MRMKEFFIILMIFFFTCFSVKGDISSEFVKEGERLAAEKVALDGLFLKIENQKRILQEKGAAVFAELKEVNSKKETLDLEIDEWNKKYGKKPLSPAEYNYANTLKQSLARRDNELSNRKNKVLSDPIMQLVIDLKTNMEAYEIKSAKYESDMKVYKLKLQQVNSKALEQAQKISAGLKAAQGMGTNVGIKDTADHTWDGNIGFGKDALKEPPPATEIKEVYTEYLLKDNIEKLIKKKEELVKRGATKEKIDSYDKKISELKEKLKALQADKR